MGDEVNTGNLKKLVCDYSNHLDSMSLHQFNTIYQLKQFNLCMKSLKRGQVLFVHDFYQNLLSYTQNEPQGHHWDHNQITIHPTVVYYRCDHCDGIIKEDHIHMMPDNNHDYQAVLQFFEKSLDFLKQKGVDVTEIHEFTDHCMNQYKSKTIFHKMSKMKIKIICHFFCSEAWEGAGRQGWGQFQEFNQKID